MMSFLSYDFEPLPPYADPRSALKIAIPALRPPENISVTGAAEKYMRVNVGGSWQPFRRDTTPYMVEPADMTVSRKYQGIAFCGPSQAGKTQMLLSVSVYAIMCDPCRLALFQMTRDAASEFERNKLAPTIRNSPAIRERQASGRGADNMHQKIFTGGTQMTLDWPVISKLSSHTIKWCLGTDYDRFPESVDGEGDAYTLMRARNRAYMSRGTTLVESSPGAPIVDEGWRAKTIHDCPPVKYGILSLYPLGTRARWYWRCQDCEKEFSPTFKLLKYPSDLSPAEAGKRAEMQCPNCGVLIGHHKKRELNISGRWLHESADGKSAVPIDDPNIRQTDMLSYWLDGTAAAFSTWAGLVTQYEQALSTFELTGDEESLKSALNTGQAQPYLPRGLLSGSEVTLQGLKDKTSAAPEAKGIAPSWSRYVIVSVDVQGNRFVVGVTAWGQHGRHQPIDRFELHTPPNDAPKSAQDRTVRPFEIAEDWSVLDCLAEMSWKVDGQGYELQAIAIGVDMHGGGATTENAYRFYRQRKKLGQQKRWFLTRGYGGKQTDRVWLKAPERSHNKKRRAASDIHILNIATDRLKDAVTTSIRLEDAGQNYCGIPGWMEEAHLLEFTAEMRTEKGWRTRKGMKRNESLDHLVQARAIHIYLKGENINWDLPPLWATGGMDNPFAVGLDPQESEKEQKRRRRVVPRMAI